MPLSPIYDACRRVRVFAGSIAGAMVRPAALLAIMALSGVHQSAAQPARSWALSVDGTIEPWPGEVNLPADSAGAASEALDILHARGWYDASVDSVVVTGNTGIVYARPGQVPLVSDVRVTGAEGRAAEAVGEIRAALVGHPLQRERLEDAVRGLLEALERTGRPGASVRIDRLAPDSTGDGLVLDLVADPGPEVVLEGILLQGATRTDGDLVRRLAGLDPGRTLEAFDAPSIRRALMESGLFASVEDPVLLLSGDSTAIVQVVLRDAAPGTFDAALGYQPPTSGSSGRIVGTGRLSLVNPFGRGRRFDVLVDRLPGQVSRAQVGAADPYVLSWPFGLEAGFSGLQQDSTFSRHGWRLLAEVRLTRVLSLTVTGTRESARPGTAGVALDAGRQRIPRSDGRFLGLGLRYRVVDSGINPSRGLVVDVTVERGSVTRRSSDVLPAGDTVRTTLRTRAERLAASGRAFAPLGGQWVLVTGLDASVVVSDRYSRSDLYRLGGARSLRGYDEDRFEGRTVGRVLAEIRRRIDLRSHAFVFADLGYVDTPDAAGLVPASGLHPGYGFGVQLDTAAGLVTATYGFNTDDGPTNGRIHVAFSFGL